MNADGSNGTLVFKDLLNPSEAPAWSPDGKRIAVVNDEKSLSQIFTVSADGSGKTRVTDGKADDFGPAWSPDGTKLAFSSRRDKNTQGYFINVDGSGLERMTLDPSRPWLHPVFSPDGKKIATVNSGPPSRIYTMNIDGSALMMLTDSDGTPTRLSWSPDGKKIVFNRAVSGKDQTFVMDSDGKRKTSAADSFGGGFVVARLAKSAVPKWKPILARSLPQPANSPLPVGS